MGTKIITISDDPVTARIDVEVQLVRRLKDEDTGEIIEQPAGVHRESIALGNYQDPAAFEDAKAELLAIHLGDSAIAAGEKAVEIAKATVDTAPVGVRTP